MKNFNRRLEKLEIEEKYKNAYTGRTTFVVDSEEEADAIEKRIKEKYGDVQELFFIIDDL